MVCEIVKDPLFLARKSEAATAEDITIGENLLDTLKANKERCVGMAANMIGISKKIIAFDNEGEYMLMYNPEIIKMDSPYTAEEGCLSLSGKRKAKRYKSVKLRWQDDKFKIKIKTFSGFTAQIIQHEIDHCNGVLI